MESKLFQELPENEREAMLEGNAHYTETMPVQKFFTPEDMTDMRREAADNQIKIIRANEVLRKAQEAHKTETKQPISDNTYLHTCLRHGFVEVEQQVYWIADWDNRMMICYDRFGVFIKSRRMLPDERQTKIQ